MILLILLTASLVAALLARLAPSRDAPLAWLVGIVLAACAGLFTQGFDHDDYVAIIETTRALSDQGIALRLFAAKDPIFLAVIDLAGLVTDNVQFVFVIMVALSVTAKVLASAALPGKRTQFMALYAVLLAPGLEFAAIRAGLAIGLIMLGYMAVRRVRWRALWISLGLASHMSVLIVVVGRLWPRWWRAMLVGLLVLAPIVSPALVAFVGDDVRYLQYLDDRGRPLAFALPIATLATLMLLSRSVRGRLPVQHPVLSKDGLVASYFVVVTALLLTLPVVTVATRVMELAWVIMLMQLLARDRLTHGPVRTWQAASWCTMVGLLSLSNGLRGLWVVLL